LRLDSASFSLETTLVETKKKIYLKKTRDHPPQKIRSELHLAQDLPKSEYPLTFQIIDKNAFFLRKITNSRIM
jgi:hypothetical protein